MSKSKNTISNKKLYFSFSHLSLLVSRYGGIYPLIQKILLALKNRVVTKVLQRGWRVIRRMVTGSDFQTASLSTDVRNALRIIPYYLNPYLSISVNTFKPSVGIHLHLYYPDMLDECASYLQRIPVPFCLYVSIPEWEDDQLIADAFRKRLTALQNIIVRKVPNRGRDIAPFIIEFGQNLLQHQFIAHIHTKRSPHNSNLTTWFKDLMGTLFGSDAEIMQIWQLLQKDGKFVYPAPNANILVGKDGWAENYETARRIAKKYFRVSLQNFPKIEFPQGTMFWATSTALKKFLSLPLRYSDFPVEPIPPDGTLAHALERLVLISANHLPGYNYCLYQPHSIIQEPAYEESHDYSQQNRHSDVKILAYYLPQFYPIPENDLWHGKGFTEWHKVRGINPLFYGHYQQRVPHPDAGYYTLSNTDILRKQSVWMKHAGIHGLVFYHYWFNGKLILEKPAQMLLADPSIDVPFCFCWANENWTRRWDGNEQEILLQQNYSADDAENFIRYLIPFFQDSRYIRIENRPVIFIYRPSSIPDFSIYQQIWTRVCAEHNLPEPYVVAVLTRGATSPNPFRMQAGVERVLHDWTAGKVRDIRHALVQYKSLNGSVLDYNDVADYYMSQDTRKDFVYFRSIIPSWDNSPRYGSEAFIVHNSSPKKFQEWLQTLIRDAETRLPADKRFILINAWNEWAESAVLDPDQRFGYAYLNSVGRALAEIQYDQPVYLHSKILPNIKVAIHFAPELLNLLQRNERTQKKMFNCLANSSIFQSCRVHIPQSQVQEWLKPLLNPSTGNFYPDPYDDVDYVVHISGACYFAPNALETMLKMAQYDDVGVVLPTIANDPTFTHHDLGIRWEKQDFTTAKLPPLFLYKTGAKRNHKYCLEAEVFNAIYESTIDIHTPVVSTIIRFHAFEEIKLLQKALYSLLSQGNCIVQPVVAVQDLSDDMLTQLQAVLSAMPWENQYLPIIQKYYSDENQKDLRARMLNEPLKNVKTRYVAFLDYDDILFPHAYAWLLNRLEKTGKNASFGNIYTTVIANNAILKRYVVYDYGKTYADFWQANHTPLHGFMLDLSKIDVKQIEYDPAMKYMEDYYLTLQVFGEKDTDWESLRHKKFIGDYCHYQDKDQTLAILDEKRDKVVRSPEFIACEEKINTLKSKIRSRQKK